jgi:tungstate transport system ATP-binding protein
MDDFKGIIEGSGTTTAFVSHDLMEINYLTSTLAIIVNGEIMQYGSTQRVLEHPNSATSPFLNEWKKFYPLHSNNQKPLSLMR